MTETLEQYRRAEHLCLRCNNYDEWTEEGRRLCWRCMVLEGRSKADVMRAHGYTVREEQNGQIQRIADGG